MEKKDLISRESVDGRGLAFLIHADGSPCTDYERGFNDAVISYYGMVRNAPAVEAEPIVHARWDIRVNPGCYDTYGRPDKNAHCTHCGFVWTDLYSVNHYFKRCPNCGAHMDEEVADGT